MTDWILANAALAWLGAALLLALGELALPGVFLVFVAVAAAITGAALFALPALPLGAQIGTFAVWSVVAVLVGRRWYSDYPVPTDDPLLNNRAARLVGSIAIAATPIQNGEGRVRIGDGEWPAHGDDAAPGDRLMVLGIVDGVVQVARAAD